MHVTDSPHSSSLAYSIWLVAEWGTKRAPYREHKWAEGVTSEYIEEDRCSGVQLTVEYSLSLVQLHSEILARNKDQQSAQ